MLKVTTSDYIATIVSYKDNGSSQTGCPCQPLRIRVPTGLPCTDDVQDHNDNVVVVVLFDAIDCIVQ
jgi:hypothetical protein